jgi:hypothetical protein
MLPLAEDEQNVGLTERQKNFSGKTLSEAAEPAKILSQLQMMN